MDEDGVYIVSCPQLKGCHSYGETIEEAMENIKEAIELCLEDQNPNDLNKLKSFTILRNNTLIELRCMDYFRRYLEDP
ncbi:MAG: type II toxin-antitoxin system HicB family antitoxin [Candidatus Methanofastidiosum sp.]|nr:type II toxin-antitoxin system HicB family antitoxin [Methanofastidiosum sp.]